MKVHEALAAARKLAEEVGRERGKHSDLCKLAQAIDLLAQVVELDVDGKEDWELP